MSPAHRIVAALRVQRVPETTMAAITVAAAPGGLPNLRDEAMRTGLQHFKPHLRTERPPHDYGRVWLFWASTRMPGLLHMVQQQKLVEMIWQYQQSDGG